MRLENSIARMGGLLLLGLAAAGCMVGEEDTSTLTQADTTPWQYYDFYEPTIHQHWVFYADSSVRKFHHSAAIEYFHGQWVAIWYACQPQNGAPCNDEGTPGQGLYMSTSTNLQNWSRYILAFSSYTYSDNPIARGTDPKVPTDTQWGTALVKVTRNGQQQLWALWRQLSTSETRTGLYFSVLADEDGAKWHNKKILNKYVSYGGHSWNIYPTGHGTVLDSGRVVIPINLLDWQNCGRGNTINGVLYLDPNDDPTVGANWHISAADPVNQYNWEPSIWQGADGTTRMFARYDVTSCGGTPEHRFRSQDAPVVERQRWLLVVSDELLADTSRQ